MSKPNPNFSLEHNVIYRWAKRTLYQLTGQSGFNFLRKGFFITHQVSNALIILCSFLAFGSVIFDFGYKEFYSHDELNYGYFGYLLIAMQVLYVVRFISEWTEIKKWKAHLYNFLLVVLIFYLARVFNKILALPEVASTEFVIRKLILYLGLAFVFLTEATGLIKYLYQRRQNPAFIFVSGFAVLICIGSLLLLLPNSTTHGISFVDALFTSASAVCVTGLGVVDTELAFTGSGKTIILLLIQLGGLGIMTFTGLLAYLASGSVSFSNQMALKSAVSSNRVSNVITIITRIIIVTLFFESIGAFLIYTSVDKSVFESSIERIFFAVFHAISAFCNAGFSTESAGLYTETLRFNYYLQLVVAILIILGGMGFPIVFNIFSYIRLKATRFINRIIKHDLPEIKTRILRVNSKLAITTTLALLSLGFFSYLLFEQQGTLKDHETLFGKIVTAFFGSVTPRTAGFNTVDLTQLTMPMVMLYLLLMWIGASPSSTGGGIKTTTFAVAFLNLRTIVRDRKRTEVFHTQISESSINRAFAVMLLSLLIIGFTVLLISIFDADKGILNIAFEAFSAFSTVGLTLGITPNLSDSSKVVLVVTMFIGRVGTLTLLMALFNKTKEKAYQYPEEEIQF